MKKYLSVSLLLILLLTGCKNTLTCKLKQSETDYDVEQKIVFDIDKKGKVNKANLVYTMIYKDEKLAKDYYNVFDSLNEDYDIEQKKNKIIMKSTQDYTKYNQTKKEVKKDLEKNGYSCK